VGEGLGHLFHPKRSQYKAAHGRIGFNRRFYR
jgi:hypothetical protein